MEKVGNEETMVESLLALETDTRTPLIQAVCVGGVDSQAYDLCVLVYGVEPLSFGIFTTLVATMLSLATRRPSLSFLLS